VTTDSQDSTRSLPETRPGSDTDTKTFFPGLDLGPEQVTVVSGPFGSGKTALLTKWFHHESSKGRNPRWFSAGADPKRRASDPEVALQEARLAFVRDRQSAVTADLTDPLTDAELTRRCDQVAADDRVVFLDRAEFLSASVVEELIRFAGSLAGSAWRLVFATSSTIQAPLKDGRAVTTRLLGPTDLRLSEGTVGEMLAARQPLLTDRARARIVDQIDGWATGAGLAAAALASVQNPNEIAVAYCGRDIEVSDLFETEVFSGLAPSDQEFLVQSSVLPELDPQGCDFVTGGFCSFDRLARLARGHLLIFVDMPDLVFRWMPMAQDFLLAKLEQRGRREVTLVRRRAAEWHEQAGRYDDALDQAVAAHDWDFVVETILGCGLETIAVGEAAKVSAWLTRLPSSVLRFEGGLAVIGAAALWATSGFLLSPTIDDWLDIAQANPDSKPPAGATSTATATLTASALFGSAGAAERVGFAQEALTDERSNGTLWAAMANYALGLAAFFDDQPVVARQALSDCLSRQTAGEAKAGGVLTAAATSLLALLEYETGEDTRAGVLLAVAELHEASNKFGPGSLDLARAIRARHSEQPERALELLLHAGHFSFLQNMRILAFLDAAGLYAETDQPAEARACIKAADDHLAGQPSPDGLLVRRRRAAEKALNVANLVEEKAMPLTKRELEVLRLLDTDLSRREIADELYLSHNTVKTYVQRLYQKLDVSSRPAAVVQARQRGWFS